MARNLDLLITEGLPTEQREFKPVSPTLLIGIGGTGKEILLRFRRLIVERYGTLEALPFIQFVHLDTDQTRAAQEQYDIKSEDDPLFSKIRFQPAERIDLTIEGGTGIYVDHIDRFPNVKRWFETKGKIAGMGDLGKGAGQFRSASRLGFFHDANFQSLSSRLDRVGGLLRDAANQKQASKLGFKLDAKRIEVAVVASIAGGTGGGCFLDMGNLLKKVFPGADRVGIFLLPNFFRGYAGATRARANGYAALTELNYYSFGHSFLGDWDAANPSLMSPPPYSNTYLIDATNEAGLEIASTGGEYDIYSMVAEFLYQDFSIGSFSGMKRATRVNLEQFNLNVYVHNFLNVELQTSQTSEKNLVGDTYPTRFGSFGLSSISFPTDRVHNACACRLARRILKSWETTTHEDPLERLFTSFLIDPAISFAQGRYERRDGGGAIEEMQAEDALLWYDQASGKTFTNHIWDRARSLRGEVEAAPKGQKGAVLDQHLNQADQLLAREDSANPDEWGQWVRMLEDNQDAYVRQLKDGIRTQAEEVSNNPQLGVAVAMSLLRELKTLLRNDNFYYLRYFEDSVGTWQEETTRYSSDLARLQLDVKKHDQQRLFRTADLKRDLDLLVADSDDDEDLGAIYNYLYARVMKQVAKRGKYVCEQIDKFLGKDDPTGKGLIADYYQLLGGFHKLGASFKTKEEYFSQETASVLHLSLYQRGDVDEWYQTWVGEPGREPQVLKRVGNELLSNIFGVSSVTQALEHIQVTKTEEVEDQVFAHCKRFFAKQEEQPQALKMLLDAGRLTRAETEEKLRLSYNLSKVWLAKAKRGLEHAQEATAVKDDQRPCLIGLDTSDKARAKELQQIIGNIDDSPRSFLNIGEVNRGMIVFYNELAGVPAFYGASVTAAQGLMESYRNYRDKGELHIDRNRFQFGELIPKTAEEAKKYAHSLRAFVLARILGLLRVRVIEDQDSEQPTFRYIYRKSEALQVKEIDLGEELNAVDILYRDASVPESQTDRAQLLEQVEDVIGRLQEKGLLDVYALLIEFYQKNVYPPTTDNEWVETLTIHQFSPEYAVLEDATNNIKQLLPDKQERDQFREALGELKGKVGDLSYEEYVQALKPYCKRAGQFAVTSIGAVGLQRVNYRDALVLDLTKIDQSFESYEDTRRAVPPPEPEPRKPIHTRPCPDCHQEIDVRAIFCKHCRKTVAEHQTCGHCGENQVPNDLEKCWKCGRSMPAATKEKIECPRCYDFVGYETDFPCHVCGYDLAGGDQDDVIEDEMAEASGPVPMAEPIMPVEEKVFEEPAVEQQTVEEVAIEAAVDEPPPPVPEAAGKAQDLVECPSCFETVERDSICSFCGYQLESN